MVIVQRNFIRCSLSETYANRLPRHIDTSTNTAFVKCSIEREIKDDAKSRCFLDWFSESLNQFGYSIIPYSKWEMLHHIFPLLLYLKSWIYTVRCAAQHTREPKFHLCFCRNRRQFIYHFPECKWIQYPNITFASTLHIHLSCSGAYVCTCVRMNMCISVCVCGADCLVFSWRIPIPTYCTLSVQFTIHLANTLKPIVLKMYGIEAWNTNANCWLTDYLWNCTMGILI